MKINHSAIRSAIKIIALTAFIASIIWRLSNLMRYGGSLDKASKQNDMDNDESYEDTDDEVEAVAPMATSSYYAESEESMESSN